MAMSPMVMYLGLAAVVAVLFFLFVMPEMKSRVGGIPHSLVHDMKSLAQKSLHTNQSHDLGQQLFAKTVGPAQHYNEELYALGGGYDTLEVSYGKDETDMNLGSKSKSISGGDSWAKKFENSADHPVHLAPIPERHDFYSPYARNDSHFTKSHTSLPGKHWEKKFEHHPEHVVANRHTRHIERAGHHGHDAHKK
tara:strand:- start:2586 stop:3167 length:582 start_codon:yes stop_codon:yes gene_type:complete